MFESIIVQVIDSNCFYRNYFLGNPHVRSYSWSNSTHIDVRIYDHNSTECEFTSYTLITISNEDRISIQVITSLPSIPWCLGTYINSTWWWLIRFSNYIYSFQHFDLINSLITAWLFIYLNGKSAERKLSNFLYCSNDWINFLLKNWRQKKLVLKIFHNERHDPKVE